MVTQICYFRHCKYKRLQKITQIRLSVPLKRKSLQSDDLQRNDNPEKELIAEFFCEKFGENQSSTQSSCQKSKTEDKISSRVTDVAIKSEVQMVKRSSPRESLADVPSTNCLHYTAQ